MEFRVGQGYDVHQIREGLPMWLCGVQVPSDRGFVEGIIFTIIEMKNVIQLNNNVNPH